MGGKRQKPAGDSVQSRICPSLPFCLETYGPAAAIHVCVHTAQRACVCGNGAAQPDDVGPTLLRLIEAAWQRAQLPKAECMKRCLVY